MAQAVELGSRFGVSDLPNMVLQESSAGNDRIGDDNTSFGIVQMTVHTAKEVLEHHPRLWSGKHTDRAIRTRLLNDDRWALLMAAQRMLDLSLTTKHPLRAYNAGRTGASRGAGVTYESRVRSRKWKCPNGHHSP